VSPKQSRRGKKPATSFDPINKDEAERDAKIRRNIDRVLAIEAGLLAPPAWRKGSRAQVAIRQFAARKWPGGHEQIETKDIIDAACKDEELKRNVDPFPRRDQFLRALGRRKG
jgi:hypothetical protein